MLGQMSEQMRALGQALSQLRRVMFASLSGGHLDQSFSQGVWIQAPPHREPVVLGVCLVFVDWEGLAAKQGSEALVYAARMAKGQTALLGASAAAASFQLTRQTEIRGAVRGTVLLGAYLGEEGREKGQPAGHRLERINILLHYCNN